MNNTLPVLLNNPHIILLGAGAVAARKARVLLDNNIKFRVVSRYSSPEFDCLNLNITYKDIESDDLNEYNIVIDATGHEMVGHLLQELKASRFILVNRVDAPEECDFCFSSLLRYGSLKIAVSTDGASPAIGQVVRDKIGHIIPDVLVGLLERKKIERTMGLIDSSATLKETKLMLSHVFLLGCDLGAPEVLSIQTYKILQQVDVVLYDNLVSMEFLALVPDATHKHQVGLDHGHQDDTQASINELMLEYAREGLSVAWLKGGVRQRLDRGGEEVAFLLNAGVRVTVVPDISSA